MAHYEILVGLGVMFLVGLVADELSRRWPIPRVTTMVAAGVLLGPHVLGWLTLNGDQVYEFVSKIALTMVGFLVGGEITRHVVVSSGLKLIGYSLVISLGTAIVVFTGLWLLGVPIALALLLAGISTCRGKRPQGDRRIGRYLGVAHILDHADAGRSGCF